MDEETGGFEYDSLGEAVLDAESMLSARLIIRNSKRSLVAFWDGSRWHQDNRAGPFVFGIQAWVHRKGSPKDRYFVANEEI